MTSCLSDLWCRFTSCCCGALRQTMQTFHFPFLPSPSLPLSIRYFIHPCSDAKVMNDSRFLLIHHGNITRGHKCEKQNQIFSQMKKTLKDWSCVSRDTDHPAACHMIATVFFALPCCNPPGPKELNRTLQFTSIHRDGAVEGHIKLIVKTFSKRASCQNKGRSLTTREPSQRKSVGGYWV